MFLIKLIKTIPEEEGSPTFLLSMLATFIISEKEAGPVVNWLRTGQNTKKKQPTENFFLLCLLVFLRCLHQNLHQMDQLKQMV